MTVHDLHDALNLLPGDLLTAADRVRTASKNKVIQWKRLLPVAACLVLLLSAGLVMQQTGMGRDKMATAEAPAAMAPAPMENQLAGDVEEVPAEEEPAAAPEMPAESAAGTASVTADETEIEEGLSVDHSHSFAEESDRTANSHAYCGNMTATVYLDRVEYALAGSDAIALTDILIWLDYDPDQVCRCMAEFTVDTETLTGIQVNLSQAFARCELGQAALTEKQVQILQNVIDELK